MSLSAVGQLQSALRILTVASVLYAAYIYSQGLRGCGNYYARLYRMQKGMQKVWVRQSEISLSF